MILTTLLDSRCCGYGGEGNFEGLLIKEIMFHEHALRCVSMYRCGWGMNGDVIEVEFSIFHEYFFGVLWVVDIGMVPDNSKM